MVCLILNEVLDAGFTRQKGSSHFREFESISYKKPVPGTIVSYSRHVGFYDPFGGGKGNELLSMPGSPDNPRDFGYRPVNASWWTNRKYVVWPK